MEKKIGRPKSNKPIRNKSITIKLTEDELKTLKTICYDDRVAYIDVLLNGIKFWNNQGTK